MCLVWPSQVPASFLPLSEVIVTLNFVFIISWFSFIVLPPMIIVINNIVFSYTFSKVCINGLQVFCDFTAFAQHYFTNIYSFFCIAGVHSFFHGCIDFHWRNITNYLSIILLNKHLNCFQFENYGGCCYIHSCTCLLIVLVKKISTKVI